MTNAYTSNTYTFIYLRNNKELIERSVRLR